jgi:hypothetical protein
MSQTIATQKSAEQQALDLVLGELQATANNFAATCINDSRVRLQYVRDIQGVSQEFRSAVGAGKLTPRAAAERVNQLRNQIMDLARLRSSATGRAYATRLKQSGKTLGELAEKYAQRLCGKAFGALSESQQTAVYTEIISAGGKADPAVMTISQNLGRIGQRLFLISLAIAIFEIARAENKPREVARQGVLASAGIAGGWAIGAGAVATGACAATAPVCVGVMAVVGGLLFAFGADLAFDTAFPRPAR